MATINHVAELAKVSIATVSRVLNESGYVKPELEARVRDAVAQLGYQPNALARSLRRNESRTLGMIIPDNNNPYFAEMAKGVEDVCFKHGFTVVLCNTAEQPEREAVYFDELQKQRVAGFVVVSTGKHTARIQDLIDKGFSVVIVDRAVADQNADAVISDNFNGAKQAVQHLLDFGHTRIGFVVGEDYRETIRSRWMGVLETLHKAGCEAHPHLIYDKGDFSLQSGYAAAEFLLNQPDPPTAVFAFNDLMAYGLMNYALTHGISIPRDLSVVGFDDIMMSSYIVPSLTTIAQQKYELGRKVADTLIKRIMGKAKAPRTVVLPTELIVRQSTGPVR